MVIRNFAKCLAVCLLASACTIKENPQNQAPTPSEPAFAEEIPGKATIEFSEEMIALIEEDLNEGSVKTKSAALNSVLEELGIVSMKRVFPDAGEYEPRSRRAGMHRFYRVVFRDDIPISKASVELSSVPGIVSVTPARKFYKRSIGFNDPKFSKQWHYVNKQYSNADINVEKVWEQYTTGNNKVIVCVVDEPVDPTQPDLQANLWHDAQGHTGYNFVRYSYDLSIRPDPVTYQGEQYGGDTGHGTHVAGTIAAVNNNGIGLCGIAGGNAAQNVPGVLIQSCAVFSGAETAEDIDFSNAIKWGADHGAVISQNSWGPSNVTKPLEEYDPETKAAIDYFIKNAGCDANEKQRADSPMKGGLVFFAAGNENFRYDPYGAYEPVFGVGAFGLNGSKTSYSNYGTWVDIAAPGGDGNNASGSDAIWSTLPSRVCEESYSGYEVVTTDGYGGPYWAGTSMACPHASGVAALIVSYFGGPGFTADDAKAIIRGGLGSTIGTSSKPIGKKLDAFASFTWALANGYGPGGGSVDPEVPAAPVIELAQSSISLKAHESAEVSYTAHDPNGDDFTVTCEAGSAAVSLDASANKLKIDGWKASAGTYVAVLTASDGTLSSTAKLTYMLLPNHAPKANGGFSDLLLNGLTDVKAFNVGSLFTDEDGEELTLSVQAEGDPCVNVKITAGLLVITPKGYGTSTVTLMATDGLGADASVRFRVAVVNPDQPVALQEEVVSSEVVFSVGTAEPVAVNLSIYASTGGLVYSKQLLASAFLPIELNVAGLAPGRYTAEISYEGVTQRLRFMKY